MHISFRIHQTTCLRSVHFNVCNLYLHLDILRNLRINIKFTSATKETVGNRKGLVKPEGKC